MWIYKHKRHEELKTIFLGLINSMPNQDIRSGAENVYKSDWDLPKDFKRDYLYAFYKSFEDQMTEICVDFHCTKWEIHNGWFQQYKKSDYHKWHTHPKSNLSAVYYLELPEKELATEFFNGSKPNVKEGDVLFFPSHMLHRSPKNKTDKRKTVIAFNCDFFGWDGKE